MKVSNHTTLFRWVRRFTPLFIEAARPVRHTPGDRWCVDETYVQVLGQWRYLCRAVDQFGQVVDVLVSPKRDKEGGPAVLHSCAGRSHFADGGDHLSGTRLPAHSRGHAARRSAHHREGREQPDRG